MARLTLHCAGGVFALADTTREIVRAQIASAARQTMTAGITGHALIALDNGTDVDLGISADPSYAITATP